MSIAEKLTDDLKEALKAKETNRLSILRMIKAAVKNKEIEKGAPLTDEEIQSMLRSFVKRARESIEHFSDAGRSELVQKEQEELAVIQQYLPEELGEDEIREIITHAIEETGASGPGDMGRVMKTVMSKVKGQADGKIVNKLVKDMLEA